MSDTAGRVEVVRVSSEHLPALAEFYRQVWDPAATPETVGAARARAAAANPVTPGEPAPTWVVLRNDRAIGHVTTIPVVLWVRRREQPAHWIKGLWVLPEFQRSSVGFLLLKAAAQSLDPALALVHEPAARRLFEALGFTDLGGLPNDLRVLDAHRLLTRLDIDQLGLSLPWWTRGPARAASFGAFALAPLLNAGHVLWAALATGPLGRLTAEVTGDLDLQGAEGLWRAVRPNLRAAAVRGGPALADRYGHDGQYVFVHVRAHEQLVGLGIVRRPSAAGDPRLGGIRIATLSDLLYRPSEPRIGLAILRGAEQAARTLRAAALLAGASAAPLRPLFRRRAFLPLPPNLHVLSRFSEDSDPPPLVLRDWWVTRGDSGGDGSF